jgi:hypothetical protein
MSQHATAGYGSYFSSSASGTFNQRTRFRIIRVIVCLVPARCASWSLYVLGIAAVIELRGVSRLIRAQLVISFLIIMPPADKGKLVEAA